MSQTVIMRSPDKTDAIESEIVVSICCITYNHADFIRDALDGFLSQECDFSYEILIHDDASTDGTLDVIREYEARYPDIIRVFPEVVNQHGKGTYKGGYVAGLLEKKARGRYIALCEGDDYWRETDKLQKQVDYLEENKDCAEVCHAAYVVDGVSGNNLGVMGMGESARILQFPDLLDKWEIPTASRIKRAGNSEEYVRSWNFKKPVGDFPSALYSCTKGYIYYFPEAMSVYRWRSPGSWTSRVSEWDKQVAVQTEWIEMLSSIDAVTGGRWHHQIVKAAVPHVRISALQRGLKSLDSELSKEAVKEFSFVDWGKYLIKRMLFKCGFVTVPKEYGKKGTLQKINGSR